MPPAGSSTSSRIPDLLLSSACRSGVGFCHQSTSTAASALAAIRAPLQRLGGRLEAIMADPPDWLDAQGRARIEGARHSLTWRCDLLAAWESLLDRLGTISLAEVLAPAIDYAEKGYPIDQLLAQSIDRGKANLGKYPTTAKIFLPNGQPLKAGELLKNADYAATLRKLVDA